jgi:hypothetical protein
MSDYDTDTVLWSERQAELLRRMAAGERINSAQLDWPNIAEEIEALARSERSALRSHLAVMIEHLIKLQASPAVAPRNGWKHSIRQSRGALERGLEESPSLRPAVAALIANETPRARANAAAAISDYGEPARVDISRLTFTEDQVLGDWWPE